MPEDHFNISLFKLILCTLSVAVLFCAWIPAFGQTATGVTFTEFKLNGIGKILIPDSMELQSGAYRSLSNEASKELGYDVSGDVIFQQKGLNDFKFKEINTYSRVMIGTDIGSPGDYEKLTTKIRATPRELAALGATVKQGLLDEFSAMGIRVLRWDGVSIVNINGQSALRFSYLRQLNSNPPVLVEVLTFQNNDRMHRLTISYRQQDASIWEDALARTRSSFTITNRR